MAIDYERCFPCSLYHRRNKPVFIDLEAGEALCLDHALVVASWMMDGDPNDPLSWREEDEEPPPEIAPR